ncbi:MAG: endo-1,4-beta-xylanase [Planctomycetota bacterium]
MDQRALLDGAEARIREHRTAEVSLKLADARRQAVAGADVSVRLLRHAFKLGCNAYRLGRLEPKSLAQAYEQRFAELLNYATLPFYWGGYEPEPGQTDEDRLERMADWCAGQGIATKGHPLVWHEVYPRWAKALADAEVLERLEARVKEIVYRFQGRIDIWDVVSEATVSHRHDHAVGRWFKRRGAAACVADALRWAHGSNPQATLLYNDFNVSEAFERLVASLQRRRAPLDAVGIQSHMHRGTWPLERAWRVCETYARFKLPLHFTELTVLSGPLKKDHDWHKRRADWHTTPEGEQAQADYAERLYTVLFSHPAVEAVTWWDFSDNGAWQGAPAGLLRKDMTPKPLYERLVALFHKRWTTQAAVTADAAGAATVRCFYGLHEAVATTSSGARLTGRFEVRPDGPTTLDVALE